MGCIHNSTVRNLNSRASFHLTNSNCEFFSKHSDLLKYKKDFDRLQLDEYALERLFTSFVKIDQDLSGEISTWELLEFLHLERTKFTKRIFRIFDEDGSGQIDFREFVMSLWNYATLGKNQLIMFAFDLYDNDGSGQIDAREVELMLKECYGRAFKGNKHAQKILEKVKNMAAENFTVDAFSDFVQKHPVLLFPAFMLQTIIQKKIVGEKFWEQAANTRISLSNGNYVNMSQILKAHINEQAFDALVMSKGIIDEGESQENRLAKAKVKMILYASGNISERKFKRSLDNNIVTSVRSTDDDIDISVDNNPPETTAKQRRATSRKSEHRTERTERTERRSSEKEKHTQKNQKFKQAGNAVLAANAFGKRAGGPQMKISRK